METKKVEVLENKESAGDLEDSTKHQIQRFEERSPDYSLQRQEIAKVESDLAKTVQTALMQKYDLAQIEKIIEIFNAQKRRIAEEAFHQAMANFKRDMPQLKKDQYNKQFDSWYTSLGKLLETYNPPLGQNGLSVSFPIKEQSERSITVECCVTHALGHFESVKLSAPIDASPKGEVSGKRVRNPVQDIKSTFTYLRSATCEAVLGVSGTDASISDDGNLAGQATGNIINDDQVKAIKDLMKKTQINEVIFLKSLEVEKIELLPVSKLKHAMSVLNARNKQAKKAPAKKAPAKKPAPTKEPTAQREPGEEG